MYTGNVKSNRCLPAVGEGVEPGSDAVLIQKSILRLTDRLDLRQARVILQFVVVAKARVVQHFIHQLTAVAAKGFFVLSRRQAGCAAVVAWHLARLRAAQFLFPERLHKYPFWLCE